MDTNHEIIYMNTEDVQRIDSHSKGCGETLNTAAPGAVTVSADGPMCSCCLSTLCLGLICAVLLGVLIGLCISHNAERDQLQSSYSNLSMQWDKLQSVYKNVTLERDRLQIEVTRVCPDGWRRFKSKCYYTSSHSLSWDRSRADCLQRGADLVIINSREEQDFVSGLGYGGLYWIGLTDSVQEGTWKWVDGTSLAQGFWHFGEPNNGRRYFHSGYTAEEDCAQLTLGFLDYSSNWKDVNCKSYLFWICETCTQYPLD